MDEKLLFSSVDIKVSNQQLNVQGQTYAIADINQVELTPIHPKRILATILFLTGLYLLIDEGSLFALGGFLIILAVVFWVSGVIKYTLVIHVAATKKQAYTTADKLLIEQVMHALDTAMLENQNPKPTPSHLSNQTTYIDNINYHAS